MSTQNNAAGVEARSGTTLNLGMISDLKDSTSIEQSIANQPELPNKENPQTAIRLKLLNLGYEPLANKDKACYIKDRNSITIDAEKIKRWDRSKAWKTTGIRTGRVIGVDLDIDNPEIAKQAHNLAFRMFGPTPFIRIGREPREMLCYRTEDTIRKRCTNKYADPEMLGGEGEPLEHRVEIYGQSFQIGVYGPHSPDIEYTWPESSLLDHSVEELPALTLTQVDEFIDRAKQLMLAQGCTDLGSNGVDTSACDRGHAVVEDLADSTSIDGVLVATLVNGPDTDFRCNASAFRADASNDTSLQVTVKDRRIFVTDHPVGVVHILPSAFYEKRTEEVFAKLSASLPGATGTAIKPAVVTFTDESLAAKYAFVQSENKFFVFENYGCVATQALNLMHQKTHPGGKGKKPLFATWLSRHHSFQQAWGLAWHPCRYGEERTHRIIDAGPCKMANTWEGFALTPVAGDVTPWLNHLAHIVPDEGQRTNVLHRFAYDVQNPHKKCNWQLVIHGVHGAGKDGLIQPLSLMFGNASATIGNQSIKGDFDDEFVKRKLVTVSEARNLGGDALEEMKRKSASENTTLLTLNPKKESKVVQVNLWSIIFITNYLDSMKMHPQERRFYVTYAPSVMSDEQISEYFGWLERAEGAAKLMRYLMDLDLSGFNPNKLPGRTDHFYSMIDATDSDMESLLKEWMDECKKDFSFNAIDPMELKLNLTLAGVKYVSAKGVKNALETNGWTKAPSQPRKRIDGVLRTKSRKYYFKTNSEEIASPGAMFAAITEIEDAAAAKTPQGPISFGK